ncbi:N-6 DNA Methylase [Butyrivibrio fibrisolvens DSM 3071]|uniref:site-specific DNA-methyltransferase (adenine-specific) n=1 Tax=Butyrivibrio fibrisolvens DSM 3071 TaxID=1121131 RepID=A0A1M6FG13_BUTFI|nr:N-6 DNA methylase [Butyrivibrio fibrisolvens]SHI96615.1 N-6 DNA Methylase [Butyrivibrio fibrisolvens DSM 3071]
MAKKEVKTDLWVRDLLKDAGIELEPQGSSVKELNDALKTASKSGTGNAGYPEYIGIVRDYLIVIEDKADMNNHVKMNGTVIDLEIPAVRDYAMNGALFYAQHLIKNTSYRKVLAFGVSGNEKRHRISPIYVDETEYYRELPDVESFISFNEKNIDEYYTKEILQEQTDVEKETAEILKDAAELHEDLRNYGNLKDIDKPLVVSGILLALNEVEHKNFNIDSLNGDQQKTDGQKIYDAIESNLKRAKVAPDVKRDKILSQFSIIKDTTILNQVNATLGKTPLKYYTEFLYERIYKCIKYTRSAEDYLGRFYGEFMSYSGGDGQTLGIVLTPKHITELFCELVDIKPTDIVLDPCCGTAGFLIAAMHNMFNQIIDSKGLKTKADVQNDPDIKNIRKNQLHGFELQPYMFTIATTNMILRGDGKSNLINADFLAQDTDKLQLKGATVGMMNPPYSQGSKKNPNLYEICFTEHLLDSLVEGARCAVIVPQSSMTGKSKEEQAVKTNILKHHTLEGVITLNKDTFYGVGVLPCIAIFTAGEPHPKDKICKFINFEDDGWKVSPHVGLIQTESAKDKKQHLLDVWFNKIESKTSFCVKSTVEATDEWLHSFYYFNDEIPTDSDFEKTIGDYLTFEFSMIMQGRDYLFGGEGDE